jgi:hypothetical protein
MALSNAQVRAIAIKRSIAGGAANDNRPRRAPRRMTTSLSQACLDAAGFAEHAAR